MIESVTLGRYPGKRGYMSYERNVRQQCRQSHGAGWKLSACVLASSLFVLPIMPTMAQSVRGNGAYASSPTRGISPYHEVSLPTRAKKYFQSAWGIDSMQVHLTASGLLIRFSYRVLDPVLAKALGDDHATPYLFGQRSHALLHVPVMDRVGQLRQTGTPEADTEYWMAFSNKGNFVKEGDRVNVMIGSFHADGLLVE